MLTIKEINRRLLHELDIELVNCNSFMEQFYRYIPLSRFIEMLEEKAIAFVNPKKWLDPYERLYLNTDFSSLGYSKPGYIFCLCGRNSTDNEEASWKVYSNGGETLIRVKFNIAKLFPIINEYAQENNCKVYYARVKYDLSANKIRNISKDKNLYDKYITKSFDDKKYIRLLSLKRPAFEYEKELRLFIVFQRKPTHNYKDDVIKIPINMEVFKEFVINPLERFSENEKDLISRIKIEKYNLLVDKISEFIERYSEAKIDCSNLYNTVKPIKKVESLYNAKNSIP